MAAWGHESYLRELKVSLTSERSERVRDTVSIACENIRFSSLFVAVDVSRGGTSATQ